jgi:hypothetical protein
VRAGTEVPVVYYRSADWHLQLSEKKKRRDRHGRSQRYHYRLAIAYLRMAEIGARHFPGEGRFP